MLFRWEKGQGAYEIKQWVQSLKVIFSHKSIEGTTKAIHGLGYNGDDKGGLYLS